MTNTRTQSREKTEYNRATKRGNNQINQSINQMFTYRAHLNTTKTDQSALQRIKKKKKKLTQ